MLDKLEAIYDRYTHLEEQLADPELIADMKRYQKVSKEYKDLKEIVEQPVSHFNPGREFVID